MCFQHRFETFQRQFLNSNVFGQWVPNNRSGDSLGSRHSQVAPHSRPQMSPGVDLPDRIAGAAEVSRTSTIDGVADEDRDLEFDQLANGKPVDLVPQHRSDMVELPLVRDQPGRRVEDRLKSPRRVHGEKLRIRWYIRDRFSYWSIIYMRNRRGPSTLPSKILPRTDENNSSSSPNRLDYTKINLIIVIYESFSSLHLVTYMLIGKWHHRTSVSTNNCNSWCDPGRCHRSGMDYCYTRLYLQQKQITEIEVLYSHPFLIKTSAHTIVTYTISLVFLSCIIVLIFCYHYGTNNINMPMTHRSEWRFGKTGSMKPPPT